MKNQATINWKDNNPTTQDIGDYSELQIREMQVRNETPESKSI